MNKTVTLRNNRSVTVISSNKPNDGISESDAEMDIRAREAVRSAINKAVICKKPIAKYDKVNKRAYIETADGERKYV
ncbi:MAG: hypothetical protein ACI4JK_09355 [Oscillospiraceae bacterium]